MTKPAGSAISLFNEIRREFFLLPLKAVNERRMRHFLELFNRLEKLVIDGAKIPVADFCPRCHQSVLKGEEHSCYNSVLTAPAPPVADPPAQESQKP